VIVINKHLLAGNDKGDKRELRARLVFHGDHVRSGGSDKSFHISFVPVCCFHGQHSLAAERDRIIQRQ
jgi:hypothetical protein